MLGELVVEIVGRVLVGVVWRGLTWLLRGVYRAATFPVRLLAREGLAAAGGADGGAADGTRAVDEDPVVDDPPSGEGDTQATREG